MSSKTKFEFFKVLKLNSCLKQFNGNDCNDIDDIVYQWYIVNSDYSNCGCRYATDNISTCYSCICGEKCIYHKFYIKNTITKKELIVGSKCVKRFMNDTLYKKYKEEKKLKKKLEKLLPSEPVKVYYKKIDFSKSLF